MAVTFGVESAPLTAARALAPRGQPVTGSATSRTGQ
jgi:hypothetical protein